MSDDDLRLFLGNQNIHCFRHEASSMAAELLEARKALRELATLSWNPVGVVQNAEHFRKILRRVGYEPKE